MEMKMTNTFETITGSTDAIAQTDAANATGTDNVLKFDPAEQDTIEDVPNLLNGVPSIVAHPTSAQLDAYSAWSSNADDAIETNLVVGQTALCTLVAFCALVYLGLGETADEREVRSKDWAKRKNLRTINSKYGAANAVAALLNLDVGTEDKVIAKQLRNRIDRDASAIDGVIRHLESQNLLNNRQALLGSSGMKHAFAIIKEQGGVESLSKEQRAYKPDVIDDETGQSYKAIELDSAKVEAICLQKAEAELSRMAGSSDGQVGIAVINFSDGKVKGFREVFPVPSIRAKLLSAIAPVPRQVELLGQTLSLGQAVHEAKSDVLVNQKDDDRDINAPRRLGSRQVMFGADGTIIVSGIFLPSRVVVKVVPALTNKGKEAFPKPAGDLVLRTAGRHHLELNLVEEERRRVFTAFINPNKRLSENPNCPLALSCSTDAAKDGTANSFYADLQRADTFAQQSLLVPDENAIFSHAEGKISQAILQDLATNRLSTITRDKAGKVVTMRVFPEGFSLECGRTKTIHGTTNGKVSKTNNGNAVRVNINKADFVNVFKAVAALPLRNAVSFSIDFDKVLKLSFETWVGAFTVFIPTATTTGVRESRLFRHLDPKPWPTAEVIEPNTDTPADIETVGE